MVWEIKIETMAVSNTRIIKETQRLLAEPGNLNFLASFVFSFVSCHIFKLLLSIRFHSLRVVCCMLSKFVFIPHFAVVLVITLHFFSLHHTQWKELMQHLTKIICGILM